MKRTVALLFSIAVLCACDPPVDMPPDSGYSPTPIAVTQQSDTSSGSISPLTGLPGSSTTTWNVDPTNSNQVLFHGSWDVPLSFPVGSSVPTISALVRDNANTCSTCADGDAVIMTLVSFGGGGSGSGGTPLVQAVSSGLGGVQTLTITPTHTVVSGETFQLQFVTFTVFPTTRMDMIGSILVGAMLRTRTLSAATAIAERPGQPGATFFLGKWTFVSDNSYIYYPIPTSIGDTLDGFAWWINKTKSGPTAYASIIEIDSKSGQQTMIPGSSVSTTDESAAPIALSMTGVNFSTQSGKSYVLRVAETGASGSDWFVDAQAIVH